jgi:hypothetical protein
MEATLPGRSIIQFIIGAGMTAAIVIGAAGYSRAALPPATARDPAPPLPPPRWAEIRHRDPQLAGWRSVGEYLDALSRWKAPPWPAARPVSVEYPSWRIGRLSMRKKWWLAPT